MPSSPDVDGVLGGDSLAARLSQWAAEASADDAAASRARERWLRQAAAEEATLAGVLVDLAEQGAPVVLHTVGERRRRVVVRAVGADFCVVAGETGRESLVALGAVQAVRPEPGVAPVGARDVELQVTLAQAIGVVAGERPRVMIVTMAGEGLTGDLRMAGSDVVSLGLDGEPRTVIYVPVAAIAELGPA